MPEHMVGADPVRAAVEAGRQVADHPEVAVPGGVRADVEARHDLAGRALEDPLGRQLVEQAGKCDLGGGDRDRRLQQEQPDQGLERRCRRPYAAARDRLVAAQRVVRLRPERLGDSVVGEPGGGQGVAQAGGEVRGSSRDRP